MKQAVKSLTRQGPWHDNNNFPFSHFKIKVRNKVKGKDFMF